MIGNRNVIFVLCTFIGLISCKDVKKASQQSAKKPNILVIIADDAGWNDVGYHGSEINTPNIDFLAKNGVQLERFYVHPTCSPSRVALLTGMPSSRVGVVAPISGKSKRSLPDSIATLPQVLKTHNYQCALFGKWHLGLDISSGPNAYGFDYSYGFLHGQIDQYTHRYKNGDASWYRNNDFIEEEGHATDLITNEAISWFENLRDDSKPFYIQLAYSAPHFPLQEEAKWKIPYLETIADTSRRDYAAAMSHMDHNIGLILQALERQNLDENTLVVFMSDNGAMEKWFPTYQYNGKHGPNPVLGSNVPLKNWKATNYEGAIRVPSVMYWKNHLNAQKNTNYMAVTDMMPTILSILEADIPKHVEGENVWPSVVDSKHKTNHHIYIRGHIQECIIQNPWKMIRSRQKDNALAVYELYNIEADPEEKFNRINKDSTLTVKMKALLDKQFVKDDKNVNVPLK